MKEGRPVEMSSRNRGTNVSFYMDNEVMKRVEEIRWRERMSKSELVRKAIEEYIRNHSDGNNTFKLDKWNDDPTFQAVPSLFSAQETWYKYLKDCSEKERLDIQVKSKHINDQCRSISL